MKIYTIFFSKIILKKRIILPKTQNFNKYACQKSFFFQSSFYVKLDLFSILFRIEFLFCEIIASYKL